uniref:F-box domain-containing protein n=1 Tax=Epicoccum nigrum TaxID=105696 RepID=A0A8A3WPW3_EPING|nr:hypothetical protein [Epicoccum nigrum]
MDSTTSFSLQDMRKLTSQLLALDRLLSSVPSHREQDLDLDTGFSGPAKSPSPNEKDQSCTVEVGELYKIVDAIPRYDLIPATLIHICKTSWQGRIYQNMYRRSDVDNVRHPTFSEVLKLLPKLDQLLETSLSDKVDAVVSSVVPFRLLDLPTEIRLQVYDHMLPRQPYLTLLNIEPRQYAIPRYDLASLRTCQQLHNELIDHFYRDQVLVMNVYNLRKYTFAFKGISPRDRLIAYRMRTETRACFKKLEIRLIDAKDPNKDRSGPLWDTTWEDFEEHKESFTEIIEAFPSLETATVSFEIQENNVRWWRGGTDDILKEVVKFLIERMPGHIQILWDFVPSSDPDLLEIIEVLHKDEPKLMDEVEKGVTEEIVKRGGTVQLGTRLIKDPIVEQDSQYRTGGRELRSLQEAQRRLSEPESKYLASEA